MAGEWNAAIEAAATVARNYADDEKVAQHDVWAYTYRAAQEIEASIRALRRPDAAPAAAARPVPQAGEVAMMIERLRTGTNVPWALMELRREAADLITSQDAEILAKRGRAAVLQGQLDGANAKLEKQAAEIERHRRGFVDQEVERQREHIRELEAALAAKDAEISYLLDDYVHWLDARMARDKSHTALAPAGKEVKP